MIFNYKYYNIFFYSMKNCYKLIERNFEGGVYLIIFFDFVFEDVYWMYDDNFFF